MAAKIGDTVRFLNDVGGGIVKKIVNNLAYVEDNDGFETPVPLRECVVVATATPEKKISETTVSKIQSELPQTPSKAKDNEADKEEPIIETAGGDKLNVVLAFEAHDLKRLSQSGFDAYLVNDSNYYLYFTFATRNDNENQWTARYAGVVEPNFQLLIDELAVEDLPMIDRAAVQIIAFKRDKDYILKAPIAYETRIDTSKFARLHCFHDNVYFDQPVIAYDIIVDDVAQLRSAVVSPETFEKPKEEKTKSRPVNRRAVSIKAQKNTDPLVIDLHISELLDSISGMSNADMLNYQIDKFRQVMDENLRYSGRRIVFIHGKGEGVLRQALLKELNYRYKGCAVQDASFREYGYGATQVTIGTKR